MTTIEIEDRIATLIYHGPDGEEIRRERNLLADLDDLRDAMQTADDYSRIELDDLPIFGVEPEGEDCAGWISCDDERVLMYDGETWTIEARDDR